VENCRVITFNPWFEPELLHKALATMKLNDKLMDTLKTGELSARNKSSILMFKLDEMSSFWLYDGENLCEFTLDHLPLLLERECHVLRNTPKMWESDPSVLPSGPKTMVHDSPDKYILFCFSTSYQRIHPPLELGPQMLTEIASMQGLETLSTNALKILGVKSTIESSVRLIAGYKTAKSQPLQSFYFSLCVFISAWYLTESKSETTLTEIAIFSALLSGFTFKDDEIMVSKILDSQSCFLVASKRVKRDLKRN